MTAGISSVGVASNDCYAADTAILGTQTNPYLSRSGAALVANMLGPQVAPGDLQEYEAGSGAAAVLVDEQSRLASFTDFASSSLDMADGFRLDGERWIRSGGSTMRATGIGLVAHTRGAITDLASRTGIDICDYEHAAGDIGEHVSNLGAASCLMSLVSVLEQARTADRMALIGYGAGSDAISLTSTGEPLGADLQAQLSRGWQVSYATAMRMERRYDQAERMVTPFE